MTNDDWDYIEGVIYRALTYSDDIVDDRPVPFSDLSMRGRAIGAIRAERAASSAVSLASARNTAINVDALLSRRLIPSAYLEQSPSIQELAIVIANGPVTDDRFRESSKERARVIANRERYEDRERCHADKDGDCGVADCPQLRDSEPEKTGRHCPIDTWVDDDY